MTEHKPKDMTIKIIKSDQDDKNCLSMSASQDIGSIPRKEKKVSETSITGNTLTQDKDNMSKGTKVGISIERTQNSSLLTPHPSVLTPPPYKNKQDYKCGTNHKTHDSHTRGTDVSQNDDDILARNLDADKKKMMNTMIIPQ